VCHGVCVRPGGLWGVYPGFYPPQFFAGVDYNPTCGVGYGDEENGRKEVGVHLAILSLLYIQRESAGGREGGRQGRGEGGRGARREGGRMRVSVCLEGWGSDSCLSGVKLYLMYVTSIYIWCGICNLYILDFFSFVYVSYIYRHTLM
jgi:hypothetical protein